VITDLFAMTSRIDPGVVMRAVPPACRSTIDLTPALTIEGEDTLIVFPAMTPRSEACYFLPAFALLSEEDCSFRFELSAEVAGEWSPWIASASLGAGPFAPLPPDSEVLRCDVDVFTGKLATRVRSRVRLRIDAARPLSSLRWLATLSASDLQMDAGPGARDGAGVEPRAILVPALSQMEVPPPLRPRICSPTSVAMVLRHFGRAADPGMLAAEMIHPALDIYGLWPAAIHAAARRGVAGYLLRFPDWASAAWCLANGLPIVASVRYRSGELTGAAIPSTDGHLLVLTGQEGRDVLVNDPGGTTQAEVPRRYRRDEIIDVWLGRVGVGYVFFEP